MNLSRANLQNINPSGVAVPAESLFSLPEKVIQFGTGVLLRGLPDFFIDKANRSGRFNGRVVVVKSTDSGSASAFDDQDGLYTLAIKGIENNQKVEETIISSAISRVISASSDWSGVLQCARNPEMKIVISNTTEVGIQLLETDKVTATPPQSFPGKLLAFLEERYKAFNGSADSGMVIVPTELIIDNASKLKDILIRLAGLNNLSEAFIQWLSEHNTFCNSLVDRIVPGKPDAGTVAQMEAELGYTDELLTVSEVYSLWAIQGGDHVKQVLSFAAADKGVVIAEDIEIFRELKLRMLNGTHTLSCGLAFLSGFPTVKTAMDDEAMREFVSDLMRNEIAPAIPYKIDPSEASDFANKVLDRFSNPYIEHLWINITVQFSAKLKMRVVPVLLNHYRLSPEVPERFALGFAAYIVFMKAESTDGGKYFGELNGKSYPINDDQAAVLHQIWQGAGTTGELVKQVLGNTGLWDTDLTALPGFEEAVLRNVQLLSEQGALKTLGELKGTL